MTAAVTLFARRCLRDNLMKDAQKAADVSHQQFSAVGGSSSSNCNAINLFFAISVVAFIRRNVSANPLGHA